MALGLNSRQPGNLLEGSAFARSRAEPRVWRGESHAHELEKIGPDLVRLQIRNQVTAILWSPDSLPRD